MREILFRGKIAHNGEWVDGDLVQDIFKDQAYADISGYSVDAETVGQYIGLTDKNGKKIFEGDIVKTNTDICVIVWQGSRFIAKKTNKRPMTLQYIKFSGEVIGNIYDNPELLKGV